MSRVDELRPARLEQECERLLRQDVADLDTGSLRDVACVACGDPGRAHSFAKNGFQVNRCAACATLYVSPRLPQAELNRFFHYSRAMAFWSDHVYPSSIATRRDIMARRVARIRTTLEALGQRSPVGRLLEAGAGYGTFLEQARAAGLARHLACIEPSPDCCRHIREAGLADSVAECTLDGYAAAQPFDLVVANGVLEHPESPLDFLAAALRLLAPGGLLVVCSAGSDGPDTEVLREHAPNVEPPHSQNFISRAGWQAIAGRLGARLLRCESIGELDLDIVDQAAAAHGGPMAARLAAFFARPGLREAVQGVLQAQGCSGFNFVVLAGDAAVPA